MYFRYQTLLYAIFYTIIKLSFLKGKSNDIFSDFKLFDMNRIFIIKHEHIPMVFISVCDLVSAFEFRLLFSSLSPNPHINDNYLFSFPLIIQKVVS